MDVILSSGLILAFLVQPSFGGAKHSPLQLQRTSHTSIGKDCLPLFSFEVPSLSEVKAGQQYEDQLILKEKDTFGDLTIINGVENWSNIVKAGNVDVKFYLQLQSGFPFCDQAMAVEAAAPYAVKIDMETGVQIWGHRKIARSVDKQGQPITKKIRCWDIYFVKDESTYISPYSQMRVLHDPHTVTLKRQVDIVP